MFDKDEDNQQMTNASDFGFTEDDLKGFVQEPKQGDAPAGEPKAESQQAAPQNPEPTADDEPKPQAEPPAPPSDDQNVDKPQDGEGHGDLGKALAEERARRKAMGDELNQLKSQLAQMRQAQTQAQAPAVPPKTRQEILAYAKQEAARRMNLSQKDIEDLMFTEPAKYEDFVRQQGAIAWEQEEQVKHAMQLRQQNVNFVQANFASLPNIQAIYQKGNEMLNDMKRGEAREIDEAYSRVDNGVGTEKDFKVLLSFRDKIIAAMQGAPAAAGAPAPANPAPAPQVSNPLTQAAGLPKAAALTGANPAQPKLSNEDILRAVREGREKDLPKDIQRAIDEYCG